jgi:7-carboxy-7-deazaguanine synthase
MDDSPLPITQRTRLPISEAFLSVQGEGKLTGVPSAFIRVAGCNMRCTWCDTPFASWSPEGTNREIDDLIGWVQSLQVRHVVLTGGEPMLFDAIEPLCDQLRTDGYHLTIETAGTIFRPMEIDLLSVSPKLTNSTPWNDPRDPTGRWAEKHEQIRKDLTPLMELLRAAFERTRQIQLKYVVSTPSDLEEIIEQLDTLSKAIGPISPADVLLMPEGVSVPVPDAIRWVVDACLKHGFRYAHRLHIELFGHTRGT